MAFYNKDNIEYTHCIDLDIMNENIFESIFINTKFHDKVVTCGNMHRSSCNTVNAEKYFLLI